MRKFALTASPLSGKSTLAAHLVDGYGFIRVDYSLVLVRSFVDAWNGERPYNGEELTVEQVYQSKEQFRRDLQEHGYKIGFNDPGMAEHWIQTALKDVGDGLDVVFDSFRGELQGEVLRGLGFTLVQLELPDDVRWQRARAMGKDPAKLAAAMHLHPELERGIKRPDISLNAQLPVDVLGRVLMDRGEFNIGGYSIFGNRV